MKTRGILIALVLFLTALSPLAAQSVIPHGIDAFVTPADGRTFYDFAKSPIPAGFFCAGSKAFTGRVALKGLPLATSVPGSLWNSDTVVERLDDAAFNAKGTAATRLQFRALSLVSIAPIKTSCGAFHVFVSLHGEQRVTAMSIHRTEEGGGRFVAPLAVDARMSFIPVRPARVPAQDKAARKLELTGSFTFPASPLPWSFASVASEKRIASAVVDTNGDQVPDTRLAGATGFLAGLAPGSLSVSKIIQGSCPCVSGPPPCHTDPATGKTHCAYPPLPPGCRQQLCSGGGGLE